MSISRFLINISVNVALPILQDRGVQEIDRICRDFVRKFDSWYNIVKVI